jgi:tyramine---L-glutamate ligase
MILASLVKIFVYEHITGGGHSAQSLSDSLTGQADAMVKALISDLLRLPDIQISLWRDARLPELPYTGFEDLRISQLRVEQFDRDSWADAVEAADAVWIMAPETAGLLESLSTTVLKLGKTLLGCSPKAVRLCGSKLATVAALSSCGIDVAEAIAVEGCPDWSTPCVLKPDDGAGCQDIWRFDDSKAALEFYSMKGFSRSMILQRHVAGDTGSLSMLCSDGKAIILSINRQDVELKDSQLVYKGVSVNSLLIRDQRTANMIRAVAEMVAAAVPGLWGFVGIDFVMGTRGPVVIEINPRLTDAYAGLYETLGVNVAELTLDLVPNWPSVSGLSPIQPWASAPSTQMVLN